MSDAKPLIFLLPVRPALPTLLTNKLEHFRPKPPPETLLLVKSDKGRKWDSFKRWIGCKSCDPFNIKGGKHERKVEYLKKRCFLVWINSTLDHRISPFSSNILKVYSKNKKYQAFPLTDTKEERSRASTHTNPQIVCNPPPFQTVIPEWVIWFSII